MWATEEIYVIHSVYKCTELREEILLLSIKDTNSESGKRKDKKREEEWRGEGGKKQRDEERR